MYHKEYDEKIKFWKNKLELELEHCCKNYFNSTNNLNTLIGKGE